jgi:lipoprotein NlpI
MDVSPKAGDSLTSVRPSRTGCGVPALALACVFAAAASTVSAPAHAYSQSDVTACNGGPSITSDQQVSACTAVIESGGGENVAFAYKARGNAYLFKGQYDLAIQDYSQVIRLKPDLADAYSNRGVAYLVKDQYDLAIQDFDEAIRLEPDRADTYINRCWMRAQANRDLDSALADCNTSLRLQPGDRRALGNRSFVYYRLGRHEDAIADGNAALAKAKSAEALYVRGLAKLAKADEAGGSTDIAAAKALKPEIAYIYARYGVQPPDAKKSEWVVINSPDSVTHIPRCMAMNIRTGVEVTLHSYGVLFMPHAGPPATLRFQFDEEPIKIRDVSKEDRGRNIAQISYPDAHDVMTSTRMRARVTFADGTFKDYDLSLVGVDWAMAAVNGPTCKASS